MNSRNTIAQAFVFSTAKTRFQNKKTAFYESEPECGLAETDIPAQIRRSIPRKKTVRFREIMIFSFFHSKRKNRQKKYSKKQLLYFSQQYIFFFPSSEKPFFISEFFALPPCLFLQFLNSKSNISSIRKEPENGVCCSIFHSSFIFIADYFHKKSQTSFEISVK